jgi:glycosyltransferase involved in cell wall biosynthesis
VRQAVPDARFTIFGFRPTESVRALTALPGIELKADVPDLRAEVQQRAVVVLPFVSGGGIKNKLLEAAAMAMPVVCTPRALSGLNNPSAEALVSAAAPEEWVRALKRFWSNDGDRVKAGAAGRAWVVRAHTWRAGAEAAMRGLSGMLEERGVA